MYRRVSPRLYRLSIRETQQAVVKMGDSFRRGRVERHMIDAGNLRPVSRLLPAEGQLAIPNSANTSVLLMESSPPCPRDNLVAVGAVHPA